VTLGGLSAAILRRRRPPQSARSLSVRQNTEVRNHAFLTTAAEVHAYPGRIDFAVTERCNLRCNHCITRAPQRTASGAARTLSPWLLDRLRGALGYASYFGFVHGGESLTAPVFFDVLEAIREARGGEPYVVHVLTNGQTLTGRVVRRLVDLGVRSLSVSLDGATAEVNDAVREGGRFDTIVANLTRAVILRSELAAGLRLGVSTVVMEQNRHQLSDLVELCARIGVDWIKLEEMAPVNAYAERSLVPLTGGPGRDAVQRALERARELGLTAVDHTADREVWRCKLDEQPGTSAFLEADEFANRSTIHPCRVAWDHACIEPNGEVKIGDFSGPPVGNLADGPFLALWNSPAAQAVRRSAPHRRLCGAGPVTCIGDDPTPSG
jgi:cyclomaltodextrinase